MGIPNESDYFELSKMDIFRGFSNGDVHDFVRGAVVKNLNHRQYMYTAGEQADSFCIVIHGALKLVRPTPRGDDVIVHIAVSGDVVGALVMSQGPGRQYPISAKSMGPTRIICIPRSTYEYYWAKNAQLQARMNTVLYERMRGIQEDKTLFASPLRMRIANLLLKLLDRSGVEESNKLSIPLTRQEIADSLGVAVESVIRIMSEWTQAGIIRVSEKQLEIVGIEELAKMTDES